MSCPAFKGGQGRSPRDVKDSAESWLTGAMITIICFAVARLAAWIVGGP